MDRDDVLSRAITRNLHEIGLSICQRNALVGMEKAESVHGFDFFRLTYIALKNDMIAHVIKVLDKNKQSATFWLIYKTYSDEIDDFLHKKSVSITSLEELSSKLKIVRDKTHFHIDSQRVVNPKEAWSDAAITGSYLAAMSDLIWETLVYIHRIHFKTEFQAPTYTGEDATKIIGAAKNAGII